MSKRAADIQLIKDMTPGFNFSAGGNGGRDETMDPASMASSDVLSTRKIAPLKRRGVGRGGRGGSSSSGANLPNVFAGVGQGVTFGGANGNASPSPANSFGGGSSFGSAPTPPTQTSFGNGAFAFSQAQQEQPKPDSFTNLAPQGQTNGSTGGIFGGGSFGNPSALVTNGLFGNINGAPSSAPPSFGGFGATANDKPATSDFNFVPLSSTPSSQPSTLFGTTSTTNAPSSSIPFMFSANSKDDSTTTTTRSIFGQQPTATTATSEPPKTSPSFLFTNPSFGPSAQNSTSVTTGFGSGLATDVADGNKPCLAFEKFAEPKPSESPSIFGTASTESSAPVTDGFFGQKPKDATASRFMFEKPAESNGPIFGYNKESEKQNEPPKSLFGAPTFGFGTNTATKDEPPKSTFGSFSSIDKNEEQAKPPFAGLGSTDKQDEQPKPTFGSFGDPDKRGETSKPSFGGFGSTDEKDQPQKSLFGSFGSSDKKDESLKSVFGAPAPTGSSIPASIFGITNPTYGGSDFGASKPIEASAEPPKAELDLSAPKFGPPSGPTPTYKPKPISFPINPFGLPSFSLTSPLPENPASSTPSSETNHAAAPNRQGSSLSPVASAHTPRGRSPPLPADSHQWSTNQLTDYYNLYAVRSLNHFFSEQLKKHDVFADLSPLCNAYIDHFKQIRGLIEKNQKYKFGESNSGSIVPGKRASEDNEERGGKRRAMGEESKVTSISTKSSSSQALASVLGGFTSSKSYERVSSPKIASVFDEPSAASTPSTWSNPFKSVDPTSLPDDDVDDEPIDTPKRTGGLFDRIKSPGDTPMSEPKRAGSLFDRITPSKDDKQATSPSIFASGGNQAWTPDKGFKFSTASNGSSIFGNSNTSSGIGGSFNSMSNSAVTSTEVSESESGTASDMTVTEFSTSDLSNQGPGEEDEDALFEITSRIYDFDPSTIQKLGVVTLRVLKNRINGKARIIGRNTAGMVIINVALLESVTYKVQRTFLIVPQFLEGGKMKKWACQVKSEKVESLREAVERAKAP